MYLFDLFKPRWQHSNASIRLAAIGKITSKAVLRKIADCSDDERVRLEAACRLHATGLIRKLAQTASDDAIRLKAAIAIQDQSCLSAIALTCWSIAQGQTAVYHIHSPMLLKRVARSAKQDAVRLTAALKLDDPIELRRVARSSSQIDIRWQIARHLNDPHMMADIAQHKPGNVRATPIRRKAQKAMITYLDKSRRRHDHSALQETIRTSPHLTFQLEAFVRLPSEQVTMSLIRFLADRDMRYTPKQLTLQMFAKIKQAGWSISTTFQKTPCIHCQGSGVLTLQSLSANTTRHGNNQFPCPECIGEGRLVSQLTTCQRREDEIVVFRLPDDA